MSDLKDGQNDGKGGRWCASCNHSHGALYECPHYPDSVRLELAQQNSRWRANLQDPAWIEMQVRNGVPPEVIAIYQAFAGLTEKP